MSTEEHEKEIEEQEDGEIIDDDDDDSPPLVLPSNSALNIDYPSSDDEPPEEILNSLIKKAAENRKTVEEPQIDPALCKVCIKQPHKYRCPRCNLRTCSLDCSKQHKIDNNCDGVRQPFTKVEKLSEYDPNKSIDDQKFMQDVKEKVGLGAETSSTSDVTNSDGEDQNVLRFNANSGTERYLLNAARFRHVWLGFSDKNAENESRHEQFSDTIFWTLKLIFRTQLEDGKTEEFSKIINNIPETIRLCTVLKQFFQPRKFGCIVSESDLDLEKMSKFIEKGIDNVNVYMEVFGENEKYYGILPENTILDNVRNRVVENYPKFVITINDEFLDMQLVSQEDLEKLSTKYGGVANGNDRFNGGRGRGGHGGSRGGGFHRGGGGRGGGSGGSGNGFGRKRPAPGGGYDNNWKRGRGGGGQKRGGHFQNRQNLDTFDPFEPFAGPTRLPIEYGTPGEKI